MKKILTFAFLLALSLTVKSQKIEIITEGKPVALFSQQTQTEIKPGWKIVDVQLKSKLTRYLWGNKASQLADDSTPSFIVTPGDSLLLADLVLLPLKQKAEYRKMPKPLLHENTLTFVNLSNFAIEAYGEDSYKIRPFNPLPSGEYIFTWLTQKPVGEYEDLIVWAFSVK